MLMLVGGRKGGKRRESPEILGDVPIDNFTRFRGHVLCAFNAHPAISGTTNKAAVIPGKPLLFPANPVQRTIHAGPVDAGATS